MKTHFIHKVLLGVVYTLLSLPVSVFALSDTPQCLRNSGAAEHYEPKELCSQCHQKISSRPGYNLGASSEQRLEVAGNTSFSCASCHSNTIRLGQVVDGTADMRHQLRDLVDANCATCHQSVLSVSTGEQKGPRG